MAVQVTGFTGIVVRTWVPTSATDHYDVYLKYSSSNAVMFRVLEANANSEDLLFFSTRNESTPIQVSGLQLGPDGKSYYFKKRTGSCYVALTQQMLFNLNSNDFLQPNQASSLPFSPPSLYNVAGNLQWIANNPEHQQYCPKFKQDRRKRYAHIVYGNSTILLTVWSTTIDELNNSMAMNNGMARLTYLKPDPYNGQYKLETTLITTVS